MLRIEHAKLRIHEHAAKRNMVDRSAGLPLYIFLNHIKINSKGEALLAAYEK